MMCEPGPFDLSATPFSAFAAVAARRREKDGRKGKVREALTQYPPAQKVWKINRFRRWGR
ncbi:hypothetical protein EDC90_10195 [Martelella mediterranea]|uniref:Uncharacterized protein n=1 Tax=Martelella mediterranea TaxID=293089 RepID=A0A4V2V451_9HYPH|nr:hypothetical protein EDC90_10195 [Martelella mediterranea]